MGAGIGQESERKWGRERKDGPQMLCRIVDQRGPFEIHCKARLLGERNARIGSLRW